MRFSLLTFCLLVPGLGGKLAAQANQGSTPLIRGAVSDASLSRPLSGVSILIVSVANTSWREVAVTDEAGRFEVRVDRRGAFRLTARRPGYIASELSIEIISDTTAVSMALMPAAQPLPEVEVRESKKEAETVSARSA